MAEHTVYEPDYVYDKLEDYAVGDTVEYISNNQMGYLKYVVVMKNGRKDLELTHDSEGPVNGYESEGGSGNESGYESTSRKRRKKKTRKAGNKTRRGSKKRTRGKTLKRRRTKRSRRKRK